MNLPPVIKQSLFDSNGNPLVGGKLYTYAAGTSTPQATYTDQGGGTPNANPVVLDANGQCNLWLDPALSYKFVLQDSSGNTLWTVDNVVGLLTNDAVNTASIQDGAVTTAKLADASVTADKLASDASVDANRPVNTNNIRDSAITAAKIATGAIGYTKMSGFLSPTVQTFTSGSGTYNKNYLFAVSAANATAAATYTHNGVTYTVSQTLVSGSLLQMTGSSPPLASGTLTRASGSGDATIAFTSFASPLYLKAKIVGAGGGGGGNGSGGNGGAGGNTTFGTSLLTANGGSGGFASTQVGGAGGTATIASPAIGFAVAGAIGGCGSSVTSNEGGTGGSTPFGGGAGGFLVAGSAAPANTGAGGGGGGGSGAAGGGGGAGGYVEAIIPSPSATYGYAVGAAGTGGSSGAVNPGSAGFIYIEEHYQ